jgi:hypothetical protein
MTEERVKHSVSAALAELLKHDSYLLEKDVNERSISHRLAVYLQTQFSGWHVDCEYNRNHDDVKRLQLESRHATDQDIEAVTVFPDIIVHKRSTDENLLVIEMKKTTSRENCEYDIRKLRAFKSELQYRFAAFVQLETGAGKAAVRTLEYF